jgi:hypothetical protein
MSNNEEIIRMIDGEEYEPISYEEAKRAGYVGSEHLKKFPEATIAYHVQSGTYWTLED